MPNHVSHKITFDANHAEEVFAACCPEARFDFNCLVPRPPQIYEGNTTLEDEQDFKCNWRSWSIENWGTKWNAYESWCKVENGKAIILFDTAWSVPYPIIAAFANRFRIPFEHRYYDEGEHFWGVEEWGTYDDGRAFRRKKRSKDEADRAPLCIELKGFDPDADDEDDG